MKKLMLAGFALAIAGGLQAAVVDEAQTDPLLKQGRSSAAARPQATAASPASTHPQSYIESLYQQKLGRHTPAEEARQNEERASSAYRAEPAARPLPYVDQYLRAKIGRTSGR